MRAHAWWAGRTSLPQLPYWLLTRAASVLAACVALCVLNGVLGGWTSAYEVLLGIRSPADADPRWCAWLLSVVGWAAIPAFVGGTAGYLITAQIQAHQARPQDEVVAELRRLAGLDQAPPTPAPPGSGSGGGS